jgi:hypothetical protein
MKKAVVWEEWSDLFLGGLLILITMSGYFLLIGFHERQVENILQEKKAELNNDDVFISYLRANDYKLNDLVIAAYLNHDPGELGTEMESFLEEVYQNKVCWTLYAEDTELVSANTCRQDETLLDSTIYMALPDESMVHIRLMIGGYA